MLTLTVDTRGLKHHDAEQHTQQHDGDDGEGDDDDDATRGAEPANRTVYYRIASQSIFKVLFSDSEVQLCFFFSPSVVNPDHYHTQSIHFLLFGSREPQAQLFSHGNLFLWLSGTTGAPLHDRLWDFTQIITHAVGL